MSMPLRRCGDVTIGQHPKKPPFSLSCYPSRDRHRRPIEEQGLGTYIILGLQVPSLLAQEAKDIGEVLVTDLTEHLERTRQEPFTM